VRRDHAVNQQRTKPLPQEIRNIQSPCDTIVESEPHSICWNQRAQSRRTAHQMTRNREDRPCEDIFADLFQAILAGNPATASAAVHSTDARLLRRSIPHRGDLLLLHVKSEDDRKNAVRRARPARNWSIEDLEEAASRELGTGGAVWEWTARQGGGLEDKSDAKLCGR